MMSTVSPTRCRAIGTRSGSRSRRPLVFFKGEPYRVVASLELLASIVSMMVFAPSQQEIEPMQILCITGQTDSLVSSMVLGKGMTTSYPLNLLAMEAAAQMEDRGIELILNWVPRELNEEADDLSNLRFGSFHKDRRIPVDVGSLPLKVLPRLVECSMAFEREAADLRAQRMLNAPERKRPRGLGFSDRLKVRDPW